MTLLDTQRLISLLNDDGRVGKLYCLKNPEKSLKVLFNIIALATAPEPVAYELYLLVD